MKVTDYLSRYIPPAKPAQPPVFQDTLSAGIFEVNVTSESAVQKIHGETRKDPALSELITLIQGGWPEHKNQLPDQALAY